ncbi:hypothetical protein PR202_ga17857 [Eleusine coracana subsp. coracana]|uniref:Uncharacterized protein n=1 Tax=Eleusine coracana subsp. coracana TaxID=191504 RepID=A0AAV5CRE3_ELECO|nr:hypothetical protein PR202_ga17857 [Eleusine coracana subsp. coracana]
MARLPRHAGEGGARVRRGVRLPPRRRRGGRAQLPGLAAGRSTDQRPQRGVCDRGVARQQPQ